jgi:hypothetical protein
MLYGTDENDVISLFVTTMIGALKPRGTWQIESR